MLVQGAPSAHMTVIGPRVEPAASPPFQFCVHVISKSDSGKMVMVIGKHGWGNTYSESDVGKLNPVTSLSSLTGPILVNVKRVSISMTDEVLEHNIRYRPATSIGLDHHHLVG